MITVAGILSSSGSLAETPASSAWAVAEAAAANPRENLLGLDVTTEKILGCVGMERKLRVVVWWWHLGLHRRGKTEVLTLLRIGYCDLASPAKAAAAMSSEIEAMAVDPCARVRWL